MPSIDMPLEQLRQYKPPLNHQGDFDAYWDSTVAEALHQPLNAEFNPYDLGARNVDCYVVRFDGYKGGRIAGWYLRPRNGKNFPGVCHYHGYSGRGSRPLDMLPIVSQGMCALSMDCRGQNGQSQDMGVYSEGHFKGWMTRGIRDPQNYYYRYVFADAVRALEVLAGREEVDESRLGATGISQGGGLTLAAAALTPRKLRIALADVPFLCDYQRAAKITPNGPYPEIIDFLKIHPDVHEQAFKTLSYCDCMNLAPRIRCKTVISNSLCDDICPPSTIFAAYNHISAEKRIELYPYHKHEIPYEHNELKFRLLVETLGQ
jgi:cephalosporin-C deacetylase